MRQQVDFRNGAEVLTRDRALKRGADELMNRAEWTLRDRPRALKLARERYIELCLYLYRAMSRRRRQ